MLAEARADVLAKIAAEGFAVTDDPRNVTPPCVLVTLPNPLTATGACHIEAVLPVTVIAPGPGNADAGTWLLDTVETLMTALDATTATVGTSRITGTNTRMPSYTLNVPIP